MYKYIILLLLFISYNLCAQSSTHPDPDSTFLLVKAVNFNDSEWPYPNEELFEVKTYNTSVKDQMQISDVLKSLEQIISQHKNIAKEIKKSNHLLGKIVQSYVDNDELSDSLLLLSLSTTTSIQERYAELEKKFEVLANIRSTGGDRINTNYAESVTTTDKQQKLTAIDWIIIAIISICFLCFISLILQSRSYIKESIFSRLFQQQF